ncbi:YrrS family protein [Salsuginibacillus kocurii]|uniref:YrrS family protein n=1 Tax=Salsuginibacillus kocurii TaxID=427078 RepID=UPI000365246E|nr:YrrS family protein [Salsuginibacillus kocurii]
MSERIDGNETRRVDMRRKKRMNRLMNGAIGLVAALILFFGVQLFFSSDDVAEEEANEEDEEPEEPQEEEEEIPDDDMIEEDELDDGGPEEEPDLAEEESEENQDPEENEEADDIEVDEEETEEELAGPHGDFEPIGTEQSGEFNHDFNTNSQNWEEMEEALRYATGINEDDIQIWRIENGGGPNLVTGYASTNENRSSPYRVEMEFIEGEGWLPTEVEQVDYNPS